MCKFHKASFEARDALTGPAVTHAQWSYLVPRMKWAADLPSCVRVRCYRDLGLLEAGYFGTCVLHRAESISVRVASQLPVWLVVETFLHEMAHARQFHLYGADIAEHGPEFGREYASIYCRWMLEPDTTRPFPDTPDAQGAKRAVLRLSVRNGEARSRPPSSAGCLFRAR